MMAITDREVRISITMQMGTKAINVLNALDYLLNAPGFKNITVAYVSEIYPGQVFRSEEPPDADPR